LRLEAGARLGNYEILASLGSGGMGEVYRARDTKLGREVAIKILLGAVATDRDRLARLEREARVLASLNHSNIATLYGFETAVDTTFLVMELVEGETLGDRIARGPIAADEAIPIFVAIAEGLEAAHAQGIVHRDLKPANIKISREGVVKILDFGLAKAMAPADAGAGVLSHSPTLVAEATAPGVLIGTASYLSPEQARGEEADRRSDIWAFGVVLWEALTGRRPFDGSTLTDILVVIVKEEPHWDELPPETPAAVRLVLRRCLTKNPRLRLQAIGDARIELQENQPVAGDERVSGARRPRPWAAVAGVAILAAGAGSAITWWAGREGPTGRTGEATSGASGEPRVIRTTVELPAEAILRLGTAADFYGLLALSPDGTRLVYVGDFENTKRLYSRFLASDEVTALAGTEGARGVFFSPDGAEVGFFTPNQVKKVSLRGGPVGTLCEANLPRWGVWSDDGRIYFTTNIAAPAGAAPTPSTGELIWVSDDGGPTTEVALRSPAADYRFLSDVLPGARHALFSVRGDNGSMDYGDVHLISLDTLDSRLLIESGYEARYVESGHLVFARAGHLMAVAFDLDRLEVIGDPVPVASDVAMHSFFPHAQYSVSESGTLAYAVGGDFALGKLAWIDRAGEVEFLAVPERLYGPVDVSADGRRIATQVSDVTDYVWVWDVEREEGRRIAMDGASGWPALDASGRRVAFGTRLAEGWGIAVSELDGSGEPRIVFTAGDPEPLWASAWSSDGSALAFSESGAELFAPVPALGVDGLRLLPALYSTSFSPDGRWLAYPDSRGTQNQVWARSYPDGKVVHQISVEGGGEPIWCDRCGAIVYSWFAGHLKSVRVSSGEDLAWEPPTKAFEAEYIESNGRSWDLSPDGQRILVSKRARSTERRRIRLVQNWFEELERLVPTGG
jgi:serine/threonine-protein kinase